MVTDREAFGAGIDVATQSDVDDNENVDFHWDIIIDTGGDVRTTAGLSELQKDLAFRVADEIQPDIGRPLNENNIKQVGLAVQDVVLDDSRIVELTEDTVVREASDETDTLVVEVTAEAEDGEEHELVFPV